MQVITVHGRASSKTWSLSPAKEDMHKTLLIYLREQGFAVASSCSGQRKCEKCVFNGNKLACAHSVISALGEKIEFDYM